MKDSDSMEITERIRRITEMESRYDRIRLALQAAGACPGCLDSIRDDIRALSAYYEDSLWREDFEADEAGLLPPDRRRPHIVPSAYGFPPRPRPGQARRRR